MLEEKAYYDFRVVKLLTLPDGKQNWVLTLTGDDRYLLPVEFYSDYGIKEGRMLTCRVDKINCSGRIYLEPTHPFYTDGDICQFLYSHEENITDEAGNKLRVIYLHGRKEVLHSCISFSDRNFMKGDIVTVRIVMIKKGRLILEETWDTGTEHLTEGEKYCFRILKVSETEGSVDMFVEGPGGIKTILNPADYPFLDSSPGNTFNAVLVKWQPEGVPLIEPDHPLYDPGRVYQFRIIRVDDRDSDTGNEHKIMWVNDYYGNEIKVFPGELPESGGTFPAMVNCRVVRLKRGRPVLRMV